MTTIAAFCPLSLQTFFDMNGAPIKGAKAYFYDAGTSDLRTVYNNPSLTLAHTSPVRTDAYGRLPVIYVGPGAYKVVLRDTTGALITQADQLPGATETAGAATPLSEWKTGWLLQAYSDDLYDGFLPLNGKTIGNQYSSATARAAADVGPLFIHLWNKNSSLAVSGGRGASATIDFAASKTIALPSGRGVVLVGADGMGNSLDGVLTSPTVAQPNTVGFRFGAEKLSLLVGQLPAHAPTITVAAGGVHTPTGTTNSQGSHTHTGSSSGAGGHGHSGATDSQGSHTHSASTDSQGVHSHDLLTTNVTATPAASAFGITGAGITGQGTEAAGAHSHSLTTGSNGAHAHNLAIDAVFDHAHSLTTSSDGAHTHAITMAEVAAHTHTATASSIGAGETHDNVQPGMIVYFHIKI